MSDEVEYLGNIADLQDQEVEYLGNINSSEPVAPDLTQDAGFFETASMMPLKGISSIGRGAAGLMEMAGNATGWDWLSQQGQQFSNEADVTDQKIRQVLGLEQDDTMNTVLNVGGEVAGALAPTGIGAKAKLGKWALASLPAIFQTGNKYETLQDRGASDGEALLGAAASFPLNAALNRIDVGAAFKPFQNPGTGALGQAYQFALEAGKRALPVGAVGAATNVAGTLGDAFLDKNIAGQSQSEEEVLQNIAMSAITGGVTGAGMVPLGMRGGGDVPQVEDAATVASRMQEDVSVPSPDVVSQVLQPQPRLEVQPQLPLAPDVPDTSLIVDPPASEQVTQYKPIPQKAPTSLAFESGDRQILDHTKAAPDYDAQRVNAEREAGIEVDPAEVKAVEVAAKKAEKETVVTFNPESATFAESPVASLSEQPAPDVTVQLPKPAVDQPREPQSIIKDYPVVRLPLSELRLSKDVPNFKRNANADGVVEPIRGEIDERDSGAIQVWQRLDNSLEVISGRHRFAFYKEKGAPSIPAQIHRESDGFTKADAATLDAEINIRDGQGEIYDYANYFRESGLSEDEATARSLRRGSKGILGYDIGAKASPSVYGLWSDGKLTDRQAAAIAAAAPRDAGAQEIGIRLALAGDSLPVITESMRGLKDAAARLPVAEQGSMFGDDRITKLITEQARVKVEIENELRRQVKAVKNAANDPANAAKMGLPVDDPDAILARVADLETRLARLESWRQDPEYKGRIEAEAVKRLDSGPAQKLYRKKTGEEGMVLNPMVLVEDAANLIRGVKKAALHPLDTLDRAAKFVTGNRPPDGYEGLGSAYAKYNDGIGGAWARQLEWMDTTAKQVPQAKGFIQAGWEMPHDQTAIVYDANQTLKPFFDLKEKRRVMATMAAARVAKRGGKPIPLTAEFLTKQGLTPKEIDAALAISKWAKSANEINRAEAIAQLEHDAFKTGQQVDPAKLADINARFDAMRDSNYVPFNRYGEHYAEFVNPDGVREWRQFESMKELNKFAAQAKKSGYSVKTGRLQTTTLGKYDGVPADILAMMDDVSTGVPIDGFRKHMMEAKLIPGADPDLERSIADYVVGQSRYLASRRMERAMERELATSLKAPEFAPVVQKLQKWKESLGHKQGAFARGINSAFNTAYIGGNLRTPIADILGRVQLQYPLIAKYAGGLKPELHLVKSAAKEVAWYSGAIKPDSELGSAIAAAQRRGVIGTTVPREMFRRARGGKTALNTIHDLYFGMKALSERSTDLGGFITGWDIYPSAIKKLKAAGEAIPSRQEFAEMFVRESKAVPSKGELPAIMNNDTVRLMSKYRTFQLKIMKTYLDGIKGGEYGQLLRQVVATLGTSGLVGLPFVRDFLVASRAAGVEPETEARRAGLGDAAIYGLASSLTGVDLSSSTGFGEVLPGVGTDAKSATYKALLGILGAPAEAVDKTTRFAERGRTLRAIGSLPFMPQLASNLLTVGDMAQRGVQTISGDGVIPKDQVSLRMMLLKGAGLTDLDIKKGYAKHNVVAQANRRDNDFINQRIADAKYRGDTQEERALRAEARAEKINVHEPTVKKYLQSMKGKPKLPKGNKQVREDLKLYE